MAKMVALKRSAAEKRAHEADHGYPLNDREAEGPSVHLDSHHLNKMGVDQELPHGHKVQLEGYVEQHTTGHNEGEPAHHMTVRITHGGTDQPAQADHGSLRGELAKNAETDSKKPNPREERLKRIAAKEGESIKEEKAETA